MKRRTPGESKKTTLYFPDELHADVKMQAARLRTSMTNLIVQAVEKELADMRKKDLRAR